MTLHISSRAIHSLPTRRSSDLAIYAHMKARGSGVIINDIGAAGERMDAGYIAGSTGNAALYALTRALGGKSLRDGRSEEHTSELQSHCNLVCRLLLQNINTKLD